MEYKDSKNTKRNIFDPFNLPDLAGSKAAAKAVRGDPNAKGNVHAKGDRRPSAKEEPRLQDRYNKLND